MVSRTLTIFAILSMCLPAQDRRAPATATAAAPSRDKISAALRWLLANQNRDGSWGLDGGTAGDISCTVVAALAIMADGNTERGGPDPDSVRAIRRALEHVLGHGRRMTADIWKGEVTLVQNKLGTTIHTIFASVLLSQVCGMRGAWMEAADQQEIRDLLEKLTDRIIRTQEPDGSWHKNTFGSLKATCMAWLALRMAASVGIDVEGASADRTLEFLRMQYNPQTKLFDRVTGHGTYQTIYATASCLRVLYAVGAGQSPEAQGATEAFMKFVRNGQMSAAFLTVEGEDYLSAALFTHALLIEDDKKLRDWYPWIAGELARRQNPDGSWTSTACISGRTFPTACALLALLAPYRQLPLLEY